MINNSLIGKRAIITGGTSGLGRSLGLKFLEQGCEVFVLGRNGHHLAGTGLKPIFCEFAELKDVIGLVDKFRDQNLKIDILINNAGILSPPSYTETSDGFEISYQVNFLAHVLLTRLMIKSDLLNNSTVINMSSPIYSKGKPDVNGRSPNGSYGVLQSYANTKLFMAMFSEKLADEGVRGFAFNPGTFSSGIYRSQNGWFKGMYKIAAPFMVSAERVASRLIKILANDQFSNGRIIGKNGSEKMMTKLNSIEKQNFWERIEMQLDRYL